MDAKPGGDKRIRPPKIFARRDANVFVPLNFFMTQSQPSVTKFSSFIFFYCLKSVITNLRWTGGEGIRSLQHFHQDSLMLCPPNFCMTLNQFSVIMFSPFIFLPPEVSDYKLGVDVEWGEGGIRFNLVAFLQQFGDSAG